MTPAISREEVERIVRKVVLERIGGKGKAPAPTLAVHASARHMHLCKADLEKLFGPGAELTVDRPLYRQHAAVDGWQKVLAWFGKHLA